MLMETMVSLANTMGLDDSSFGGREIWNVVFRGEM